MICYFIVYTSRKIATKISFFLLIFAIFCKKVYFEG